MDNKINPLIGEKTFSCPEFRISIKFLKNGLIRGTLTHFPIKVNLRREFDGLYCQDKRDLRFTFFVEWVDADLAWKALTCFSGRICKHQEPKCLILKWLQINETYTKIGSYSVRDSAVLVDSCQ